MRNADLSFGVLCGDKYDRYDQIRAWDMSFICKQVIANNDVKSLFLYCSNIRIFYWNHAYEIVQHIRKSKSPRLTQVKLIKKCDIIVK